MTTKKLTHSLTPEPLKQINSELEQLIAQDELDEQKLRALIDKRDETIQQYLASLDADSASTFARSELEINNWLAEYCQKKLSGALNQLSGLVRGRKAVEKYK